jgi:hypothetical protein
LRERHGGGVDFGRTPLLRPLHPVGVAVEQADVRAFQQAGGLEQVEAEQVGGFQAGVVEVELHQRPRIAGRGGVDGIAEAQVAGRHQAQRLGAAALLHQQGAGAEAGQQVRSPVAVRGAAEAGAQAQAGVEALLEVFLRPRHAAAPQAQCQREYCLTSQMPHRSVPAVA